MGLFGRRRQPEAPADGLDPETRRRALLWVRSGLVDQEFYGALRGRSFPDEMAAAVDLVETGMPARLSPHPFLDFASLPQPVRMAWRRSRAGVVLEHLTVDGTPRPAGPLAATTTPERDRAHMLEVARTVAARVVTDPDHQPPAPSPAELTERERELVDWAALRRSLVRRRAGRTSVVVPTYTDFAMTVRAVEAVLARSEGLDVEVVVVDNGSPPHISLALAAALGSTERVEVVHLPLNLNFAGGSNVGFSRTSGDVVVFLNNDTEVRRGWLPPLREALEDPDVAGAQPLLLYGDDTIQTAGTVFPGGGLLPGHLLVGHPPEDAAGLAGARFSAVTAAALALRAADVVDLEGFDSSYVNGFEDVDLCLRLLERRTGGFRVVPTARVNHHESRTPGRYAHVDRNRSLFVERWGHTLEWDELGGAGRLVPNGAAGGLERGVGDQTPEPGQVLAERLRFRMAPPEGDGQPVPAGRLRVAQRVTAPGRLRWCLRVPSTPGWWGDDWGDTHFAEGLADALRGLGQDVVTRRRGAHDQGPLHLDDVSLAIRGRYPIAPVPGAVNVLWVISHPDDVQPDELDGYDLVFAASERWAAERGARWGRPVRPLAQATAITPASAGAPASTSRAVDAAVFVGNANNGRRRPLVEDAAAAGVPLAVYGRGWEGRLPDGAWRGEFVDPAELPRLYADHGVVLADHWPDMARHGFVANRIYDALASGARVISDEVDGLDVLAPGRLVVHRPGDDLAASYRHLAAAPADDDAVARLAAAHSFGARAAVLLEAVTAVAHEPGRARPD